LVSREKRKQCRLRVKADTRAAAKIAQCHGCHRCTPVPPLENCQRKLTTGCGRIEINRARFSTRSHEVLLQAKSFASIALGRYLITRSMALPFFLTGLGPPGIAVRGGSPIAEILNFAHAAAGLSSGVVTFRQRT
jgi:hypothetical protein